MMSSNIKAVFAGKSIHRKRCSNNGCWMGKKNGENLEGKDFIVQSFGNFGSFASDFLISYGKNLLGAADYSGYY